MKPGVILSKVSFNSRSFKGSVQCILFYHRIQLFLLFYTCLPTGTGLISVLWHLRHYHLNLQYFFISTTNLIIMQPTKITKSKNKHDLIYQSSSKTILKYLFPPLNRRPSLLAHRAQKKHGVFVLKPRSTDNKYFAFEFRSIKPGSVLPVFVFTRTVGFQFVIFDFRYDLDRFLIGWVTGTGYFLVSNLFLCCQQLKRLG